MAGEGLEAYLPLADMVDISAEAQRLSKRLSKMQKEYDALIAKISSPQVWKEIYFIHLINVHKHLLFPLSIYAVKY